MMKEQLWLIIILYILVWIILSTCSSPLRLNLQTLSIAGRLVRVEVLPPDANCHHLFVEIYSNGLENPASHNFTTNFNEDLRIPVQLVGNYVRITARAKNGSICVVDRSLITFYLFPSVIPILSPSGATGDVMIPLSTAQCANPSIQWPANNGENCYCPFSINPNYSFSNCSVDCMTDYTLAVSADKSAVIFHNLNFNFEDFLVHFVCDSTNGVYFFTKWSSFKIRVENDSSRVVPQEPSPTILLLLLLLLQLS